MSRRKKSSTAEDLMSLVAMMPWWAGVMLAVLSYFYLHHLAGSAPPAKAAQPSDLSSFVIGTMVSSAANIGQYLLPLICLVGAGVSALKRKQRSGLLAKSIEGDTPAVIDGMSWRQFEMLVGEGFRQRGYAVSETGGGGPDGGIDLVLKKSGKKYLVQCKQWRTLKVGVKVVRELYGVMTADGADGGFVVTSGQFTEEAVSFARSCNVGLIDGTKLAQLLREGASAIPVPVNSQEATSYVQQAASPSCPVCSASMILRTAKRGPQANGRFWGCTAYPKCKGTRQES